jgi:cation-transporting ATPase 13A2
MTGRAFAHLLSAHRAAAGSDMDERLRSDEYLSRLVLNAPVFARMSPDDKGDLVSLLQSTGLYVAMCGDGANDSIALRTAHVGISLCKEEASVAAPFVYAVPDPNIEAVPIVLAEGRGALATSFCLFQYMAVYSFIQFSNALLMVSANGKSLSNMMFLYQDGFTVALLALAMGKTLSARKLTFKRPSARLFSAYNLSLIFGFIALTFGMQALVFFETRKQSWWRDASTEGTTPESTAVFIFAAWQYVACSLIFASSGFPYKRVFCTNVWFTVWLVVVIVCSLLIWFVPSEVADDFFELKDLPEEWRLQLFGWAMLSFCLYFAFWGLCVAFRNYGVFRFFGRLCFHRHHKQHRQLRASWAQQFGAVSRSTRVAPNKVVPTHHVVDVDAAV